MSKRIAIVTVILAAAFLGFKGKDSFKTLGLKFAAPTVFGKENVFNPEPGEIIYDSSVAKFFGYDHNNNWVELNNGGSVIPSGTIMPFGGSVAPNGFLIADGSEVSRETYADLFAAVGTAFGAGDGTTTFNLPDLRGRFLRGVDDTAGRDLDKDLRTAMNPGGNTGNSVGSIQLDQIKSHTHDIRASTQGNVDGVSSSGRMKYGTNLQNLINTNAIQAAGGNETRPVNAYVTYIIKY